MTEPGTLFVVGTPIGNLEDLTKRAIDTLRSIDRVAAEDTRRTRALLSHLGISGVPVSRLDAQATERTLSRVLSRIDQGESVALVTDAGMPGVSDPGARVVRAAHERGLAVVAIPGPSAVTTAVACSGLVEGPFAFVGFLPRSGGKRKNALERVAATADPVVLFEAPGRTHKTLQDLARVAPEREAVVCRELTKVHEELARGTVTELAERNAWRGEVTIVLGGGCGQSARATEPAQDLDARIVELLSEGWSAKSVVKELAGTSDLPRRELYARVVELRRTQGAGTGR